VKRAALPLAVLLLGALCGALGFVLGRQQGDASPADGAYLRALTAQLALGPDQVQRVEQILTQHDAAVAGLVEGHRQQLQQPMAEHLERTESEILAVLDDRQRALYQSLTRD
jgi:hypothetical protein